MERDNLWKNPFTTKHPHVVDTRGGEVKGVGGLNLRTRGKKGLGRRQVYKRDGKRKQKGREEDQEVRKQFLVMGTGDNFRDI